MTVVPSSQLTLNFEPGLSERHASLADCIRQCVYASRNPLKTIAADMDLSQSELSRKLSENPNDPRRFNIDDLEKYMDATGDVTPIQYLAEKFLANKADVKSAAQQQLLKILPQIEALIKAAS